MAEEFVVDVFDEEPLELEGAEVLVVLPPEAVGLVGEEVGDELGHSAELVGLDHREDEVDGLAVLQTLLELLAQDLVVLRRAAPHLVLDGLVEVVVVRAPHDEVHARLAHL